MATFLDRYLASEAAEDEIYDWIDEWHEGDSGLELHEFLGMAWPEYAMWVERNEVVLWDNRTDGVHPVRLQGGEKIIAHGVAWCEKPCAIHWPSQHHMRSWPQHWRSDRGIIERLCDHGTGHPDPDDKSRDRLHGCCGCCLGGGSEVFS